MEGLKVGIFSETYHPTINGVVVSIDTFKKELERLGHQVFVFAPKIPPEGITSERVFRIRSIPFPARQYPIPIPWFSRELDEIRHLKLDLIHTQHPFFMGHIGLSIAKRLRIPIVFTYHTLLAEYAKTYVPVISSLARNYMIYLSRRYGNQVDRVITPSESMKRILLSYGVRRPIEVIPTGIYPQEFSRSSRQELRKKYGLPEKSTLLLYVGRIATEKNIEMLLDAFALISHKHPEVYLLLVGGGYELSKYKDIASKVGIGRKTVFAGFVAKKEVASYFGASDIFVFPSTTDTQGIVLTESMAAGTPIVAVGILGPADIVKDGKTGYLTRNDPVEFAEAIERILIRNDLRLRMGNDAKKEARKYSADLSAKKLESLYKELTERANPDNF